MQTVTLFDAKTHLSRIVEELVSGAEKEIVISRHGKPVVKATAIQGKDVTRRIGIAKGKFVVPDDIDEINPVVERLFAAEGGGGYAPAS